MQLKCIPWSYRYNDELYHYGILHRSGRYPWGSGQRPYQGEAASKSIDDVKNLNSKLNSYNYGTIGSDGFIYDTRFHTPDEVNRNYRSVTPKKMDKYRVGTCWDYVNYEYVNLKRWGYKPEAFMVVMEDPKSQSGITTHSFVTFKHDNKNYWIESAWKENQGIHEISSIKDVDSKLVSAYGDNNRSYFKYNPVPLSIGLTADGYFDRATRNLYLDISKH